MIMNIRAKLLVTILIMMVFAGIMNGQSLTSEYKFAVGLRAGETSGIAFKYNMNKTSSLELIAGIWSNWLSVTGLYEINAPAFKVDGMRWYYGAGGHFASRTGTYYNEGRYYSRGEDFAFGIDGILGIEYKIPQIPFAISADIKPLMEIYRNGNLYLTIDPGIGVKFTF
jgi:hypothetical protein